MNSINHKQIDSKIRPALSGNSIIVLEKRYLIRDSNGDITETPEDLFKRVASFVATADSYYGARGFRASLKV